MENKHDFETSNTEMITISRAEYDATRAYVAELETKLNWLLEKLNLSNSNRFGSSSEKANDAVMGQLSLLFDEAEATAYAEEKKETQVKAHSRTQSGSGKDVLPDNIPVETETHTLTEEERICPECGEIMEVIGTEVHRSVVLESIKAHIREDVYYTYGCRNCKENGISTPIVSTPREPVIIPGSFASPEAVAHVATQKFVMGAPLHRQEQELNRMGIKLSRQTMSNWLLRCSKDWLEPVYEALHEQLVQRDLLHADETVLQVLHEEEKPAQSKSYMWLYRTGSDAENPIVLYEYQPSRSGEHPKNFLEGFHGYLQTDGYSGYNAVPDITRVGCLAHARRKFEEAMKALPKGKRSPTAEQGVAYCTKLFNLETEYTEQGLTFEERKKQRLERSKPVLDAMLAWANTRAVAPKSKLGMAITYLLNQWVYLNNFLLDGRIEISNNRAERSIKPFVISRKNFLFANTPKGAKGSAVIFSLIETAKENGLDPYRYLVYVLTKAPKLSTQTDQWAKQLTPECCKQTNYE